MIYTVKAFGIVNKAVDIFLELCCFFDDPTDVGNLISGSSAFSNGLLLDHKKEQILISSIDVDQPRGC